MAVPTVSILIPCYNAARWLRSAIDSALNCRGVHEVIVVDDGSTDESPNIARAFGGRIHFFESRHRGGNATRNELMQRARGEWLQFLDADDYLQPEKIFRQLGECGDLGEVDVLYSPVWLETWHNGRAPECVSSTLDTRSDLFTQWISWQLPQTGGILWRATALRAIGGWNLTMPCCQEHELYLRALQAALRWKYCPSPGAVYRLWSEQTVCRKDPVLVINTRTMLIDTLLGWLEQCGQIQSSHRAAAGQAFFEMARTWARHDQAAATNYLRARQTKTGIRVAGPAAPFSYRAAFHLFGFSGAERLARLNRSRRR